MYDTFAEWFAEGANDGGHVSILLHIASISSAQSTPIAGDHFHLPACKYSGHQWPHLSFSSPSVVPSQVNSRPSPSSPMTNNISSQIRIHLGVNTYRLRSKTVVHLANQRIVRWTDSSGGWDESIDSAGNTGATTSTRSSFLSVSVATIS